MKKHRILFSTLLLLTALSANAQSSDSTTITFSDQEGRPPVSMKSSPKDKNTVYLNLCGFEIGVSSAAGSKRNLQIRRPPQKYYGHLGLLELGFNDFVSADYSAYPLTEREFLNLQNGRSIHLAMNLLRVSTRLNSSGSLGLSTALGILWNNYVFSNDITLIPPSFGMNHLIQPEAIDPKYKKSKLTTFALHVPITLEFNRKKFYITGGVYGDLILRSYTKIKKPKEKSLKGDYVNFMQAGITARVGYGLIYFFGNYGLSEFFKHNRGPKVHTATIGIGLDF